MVAVRLLVTGFTGLSAEEDATASEEDDDAIERLLATSFSVATGVFFSTVGGFSVATGVFFSTVGGFSLATAFAMRAGVFFTSDAELSAGTAAAEATGVFAARVERTGFCSST
jgi:hypothetical protein